MAVLSTRKVKSRRSSRGVLGSSSARRGGSRLHPNNRARKSRKSKLGTSRFSKGSKSSHNKKRREAIERFVWTAFSFIGFGLILVVIFGLYQLKLLTDTLPDLENPQANYASSKIYSREGVLLYQVNSAEFARDIIKGEEFVPETLKWAFLAGEDESFYEHTGVDFTALTRCVFYRLTGGPSCGGSTISQQVILNGILERENSYVRKIKDIILALQLERKYSKEEVMNLYLNVVPQGGGRLGVKTGAKLYFDKELNDLTLAEMAVLASIIRNPSIYSPTIGSDVPANTERLHIRTDYILDQMSKNLNRINRRIEEANETQKDLPNYIEIAPITKEELEAAKQEVRELEYQDPKVDIKAPHMVFYALEKLQERGYNNGEPFTENEIQTGGLKIYTTLDFSLQDVAQKYVSSSEEGHAGWYRNNYGAGNSALITLNPKNGEILTMVGSKCYQDNEYISDCDALAEEQGSTFDPDVNVLNTLQSPGSTNKALGYYLGFRDGVINTTSTLPDVPLDNILAPGYRPKNWNGAFSGSGVVRRIFPLSLNIPALFLIDATGVDQYIQAARDFGYTTYGSPDGYGPAVVLGGTDVKAIEHAQAFGVFANNGNFNQHEVIYRIEDSLGNVIYEHNPEPQPIADPGAVYLVNHSLNPRHSVGTSPVKKITGRDVAGKTGTSENNRDTWFAVWSPEFVTVGWMGNNDNTRMSSNAFGSTSAAPWIENYMNAIMGAFPNGEAFAIPDTVVNGAGAKCVAGAACSGNVTLGIEGRRVKKYVEKQTARVCSDQPDRLAREIDEITGYAVDREFTFVTSPSERLQEAVDKYFSGKVAEEGEDGTITGGLPTEMCDIPRFGDSDSAQGIIYSPQPGQAYTDSFDISARAYVGNGTITKVDFQLDGRLVASGTGTEHTGTVNVSGLTPGNKLFEMIIYTDTNAVSTESFNVYVGDPNVQRGTATLSAGSTTSVGVGLPVGVVYDGGRRVDTVELYSTHVPTGITNYIGRMNSAGIKNFEATWVPARDGEHTIYAVVNGRDFVITTNSVAVNVANEAPPEEETPPEDGGVDDNGGGEE